MFGERIKQLREEQNLNQKDLSKLLYVSKQTVSNWENNNILPSVEKLCSIARHFSCSVDYLLEFSDHNDIIISTNNLQEKQIGRIRQLINDFENLNHQIEQLETKVSDSDRNE